MQTAQNPFLAPKPSACTNDIQSCQRAFNRSFPVFVSFLTLECRKSAEKYRKNIYFVSFLYRPMQTLWRNAPSRQPGCMMYMFIEK